jgi:hypothetical protein
MLYSDLPLTHQLYKHNSIVRETQAKQQMTAISSWLKLIDSGKSNKVLNACLFL